MNCLYLVLLLLCCGNSNNNGCGCFGGQGNMRSDCGFNRNGRGMDRGRNDGCGCNDREPERNDGCGCRNDDRPERPEPRLEHRPFIPYPGPSCGCEESEGRGGCNCTD